MIYEGDCLNILKQMDDESMESLITDPPAGISFMGKSWDNDKGGRKQWIVWMTEVMTECLRVMKPGAHGLVWAIPRTSHWTATALEDAGFEIRDVVTHLFGSGFPKSLDISKAIDKQAGAEREYLGEGKYSARKPHKYEGGTSLGISVDDPRLGHPITAPSTPEAKQWQGWGTALKPASEHWILIRKPIAEKTVAANVLKHGTGGINIDASRISIDPNDPNSRPNGSVPLADGGEGSMFKMGGRNYETCNGNTLNLKQGRFPANLVLSHNPDCVEVGTKKVKGDSPKPRNRKTNSMTFVDDKGMDANAHIAPNGYASPDGTETVAAWECTENCAVAMLDEQSGMSKSDAGLRKGNKADASFGQIKVSDRTTGYSDLGGASRFFYCAKASKKDKNAGLEDSLISARSSDARPNSGDYTGKFPDHDHRIKTGNFHPTVKSTKLMEYLITMITPPNGIVLDPFMGSGSTLVAAKRLGFQFVGIEQNSEYIEIAKKRLEIYAT